MFTKDELKLIFNVFSELEVNSENKELTKLKSKMALLDEQVALAEETQEKMAVIQDKIQDLEKGE